MGIITVRNAAFAYNGVNVFEEINLTLEKGEILCLFGPNGCGKTTLLDNILGHLNLDKGYILIEGMDQKRMKHKEIARKIAYVPQIHERTFPYRVLDVVVMGRTPHLTPFSSPGKEDYEIAEDALEIAGISRLKDRLYTTLSGGETQLVILARALAQKSPVIIMDEPSSHLDFRHELMLMETIAMLVKQGLSILMSTHSPNHAFYFANNGIPVRIAVMNGRRITDIGKPDDIISEDRMKTVFNIESKVMSNSDGNYAKLKYIIPLGIIK